MTTQTTEVTVPPAAVLAEGPAVLVLEDGTRFTGRAYGATGQAVGELSVFTAVSGFQEVLTDPAHKGQIILMATPHIGNTGVNDADKTSDDAAAAGLIVRDPARRVSNFRAERSLDEDLVANSVVGISGVDTRAITRRIRQLTPARVGIFSGESLHLSEDAQLALVIAETGTKETN